MNSLVNVFLILDILRKSLAQHAPFVETEVRTLNVHQVSAHSRFQREGRKVEAVVLASYELARTTASLLCVEAMLFFGVAHFSCRDGDDGEERRYEPCEYEYRFYWHHQGQWAGNRD